MLARLKNAINKRAFLRAVSQILETPPIAREDGEIVFFSMLQSKDVLPYLLAIKAVYRAFGAGRIIVLNDGSLTERDKQTLRTHLVDPEFLHINDVDTGNCPTGGCWERLVTAVDLSQNDYVVQVDADIVCTGSIESAVQQSKVNNAFSLGNSKCPGVVTFHEMSDWISEMGWNLINHIQVATELRLTELPNASERKYIRATAAFTGFSKGGFNRETLETFSAECQKLHGERWSEWGTEQISSNYLIANSNNPYLLKPPTYINNAPHLDPEAAELIHFFGTYRYDEGRYRAALQKMFSLLMENLKNRDDVISKQ